MMEMEPVALVEVDSQGPMGMADVVAFRSLLAGLGLQAKSLASITSMMDKVKDAFATISYRIVEGSLDFAASSSIPTVAAARLVFVGAGFAMGVAEKRLDFVSPTTMAGFKDVFDALKVTLGDLEKELSSIEMRADRGKRKADEMPVETPSERAKRRSGLASLVTSPDVLRRDAALQERAKALLASGGPGHPPLGSEASGAPQTWQDVDRSKILFEHELYGQLQVGPGGNVTVNKARVPTLLQWRETNFAHLAKLEGVARSNFQALIIMYERLVSVGHEFSVVYKFSLEAAELCKADPAAPFNADVLAARFLTTHMMKPGRAIPSESGVPEISQNSEPCHFYNGTGQGCRFPDSCRQGPHRCTICHAMGGSKDKRCPCRTGGGGFGGRGNAGGRGRGGRGGRGG
mmetsp:Transcript_11486/g.23998  ORF Transcript_11486/g.23998 Transcript_11486/m.23998 type:complete len:404 (-) Transcript_11486:215-1426(-)